MKKNEYFAPEMEVVELRIQTMLCASPVEGSTPTGQDNPQPGGGIFD